MEKLTVDLTPTEEGVRQIRAVMLDSIARYEAQLSSLDRLADSLGAEQLFKWSQNSADIELATELLDEAILNRRKEIGDSIYKLQDGVNGCCWALGEPEQFTPA